MSNNGWTSEGDRILLKLNGEKISVIEKKLNELVGNDWRFIGLSPQIYANPPIQVRKAKRNEIIDVLNKNNLLHSR